MINKKKVRSMIRGFNEWLGESKEPARRVSTRETWQESLDRILQSYPYLHGSKLGFVEEGDPLYAWLQNGMLTPDTHIGGAVWSMRVIERWRDEDPPDLWELGDRLGLHLDPWMEILWLPKERSGLEDDRLETVLVMRAADEQMLREVKLAQDDPTEWAFGEDW